MVEKNLNESTCILKVYFFILNLNLFKSFNYRVRGNLDYNFVYFQRQLSVIIHLLTKLFCCIFFLSQQLATTYFLFTRIIRTHLRAFMFNSVVRHVV